MALTRLGLSLIFADQGELFRPSLAAQSELTHYAARGTGGWIGGASAGLVATAAATGPGVVGFIVVGGAAVAGAHVGEHVATVLDSYKRFKHTDLQGVDWQSNGRQWVRQDLGDQIDDGQNHVVKQTFSADPEKADELNYRASNVATDLAIGKLRSPQNPYSQPAAENDPVSMRRADWERNPQTGAWDRKVVVGFEQPGVPMLRIDHASAERAAELDQASQQVIRENIASGPAPMAARYEMVHRSEGWERFGVVPPSIQSALRDDSLVASDGKLYQRTGDGQWQRNGESVVAAGNLRQELESTRAVLQPQLAQHKQQVASIPDRQPPTLEDIERKDLLTTYAAYGVTATPEQVEATLEAVRRTQQEYGVAPLKTSLHLGLNASGERDINSPIEHISHDADGVNRIHAVTSPLEVQMAMLDLRSPPPTTPEAPELRIANLSPQQHEALEQVVREANRLGLTRDDVQVAAKQAVAGAMAADREPEIVVSLADMDRGRPQRTADLPRDSEAPSSTATKSPAAAHASEASQEPHEAQAVADRLPAHAGLSQTAQAAVHSAEPMSAPPRNGAESVRVAAAIPASEIRREAEPTPLPAPSTATTQAQAVELHQRAPAATPPRPEVAAPVEPVSRTPVSEVVAPAAVPAPDAATPPREPAAVPVAAVGPETTQDDTLRPGSRGQDVELLQYRLQRVGYRGPDDGPLPQNGHFDATTEHAVRQFQRDQGLPDTGLADPTTQQTMLAAQHARIESRKAASQDTPTPTQEPARAVVAPVERTAPVAAQAVETPPYGQRQAPAHDGVQVAASTAERQMPAALTPAEPTAADQAQTVPAREFAGHADPGPQSESSPNGPDQTAHRSAATQDAGRGAVEPERQARNGVDVATLARDGSAVDVSKLSPNDQAMFAKIRAGAPDHVSDETVAAAMLSAKRDKIHDAESIAQVGVAHGKLWVGSTIPGFYGTASLSEPPPAMQETLREAQTFNQQREQQLAQEASQRNPDDPSRGGPSR
ncbi:peptidoglycan-binding protein [Lysobacter sp. CA199]|uniref:peptidoglycan-binding protein n=1 Tax=Lysobacter sp. CA199 TaxID=3455608 RepID=UPI003F8D37A5